MKGIEEKQIEAPYELPEGWKWVKVGEVAEIINGKNQKEVEDENGIYPIYGSGGIIGRATDFICPENCTIIGRKGTINNPIFVETKFWNVDTAFGMKTFDCVTPKFYFYFCKSFNFLTLDSSTAIPSLTKSNIQQIPFPLPPTQDEQQRIVNRIESMFAKLDEAKEKAQNVVDGFETRKAAILHKAFTGELTAKWRRENGIEKNKELDFIYNFAQTLSKKDMTNITDFQKQAYDYVLSDGAVWKKCCIGAIGVITNGSTPSRKEASFWNGNIPWVSSGEVANNIIESTNEMISEEGFNNSSVKKLPIGTVLIAMIGEGKTRGQTSVLNIEATTNQNIAAIIINHGHIESKFLWYWLQKEYKNNRTAGNGSGPQALNCQKVRELPFILPTLPEQVEIVRILDIIIEKENKAKQAAEAVLEQIDLLKKSILARAFRGEL